MTVFELLGIESGDTITVNNPWSEHGPREVIPLAFSQDETSIRVIDCRYGDIRHVDAEWTILMSNGEMLELQSFSYVAQKLASLYSVKYEQGESRKYFCAKYMEREFASLDEILSTIKLNNLKVVITGTLPIPRKEAKTLLENKGAIVVNKVSKQTSFLLMGNTERYKLTAKMKRAHQLGVKIIAL